MSDAEDLGRFRQMDDEQLIRSAARRDTRAFAVLYERHHALGFSLAIRIVGSRDQAQDVVHEAFLHLWRDAGRYDPTRGLVRTWLVSIVHDRGIDFVRRLSVQQRMQIDATAGTAPPRETGLARERVNPQDDTHAICVALQALPEDERRIIELAYFGGWTQDEIAEMLELPVDTVKRCARHGLLKLRDALMSEAPP